MKKRTFVLIASCLGVLSAASGHIRAAGPQQSAGVPPQQVSAPPPASVSPQRALLNQYCVTCHNERIKTAGLMLDKADVDVTKLGAGAEIWEKVVRKLRASAMPPQGVPRPDKATYDAFASWLETNLDQQAAAKPNPGWVPIHRITRAEYTNAIRDLVAVEIDGRSILSADDFDHGFDNMAGVLSLSPSRLEQYMSAARRVSRLAVGDPVIGAAMASKTYATPLQLYQDDRISEDLPFGSRGGMAIRHTFPLDGEYIVKIRLRRTIYQYIRGLQEPHQLEVRLNGERVKAFTIGGGAKDRAAPVSYSGTIFGDPDWEQYTLTADDALEGRFSAKAGTRVLGVSFVKRPSVVPEGVLQPPVLGFGYSVNESRTSPEEPFGGWGPAVESVFVGGPYNATGPGETASRRKIFVCRPAGSADEEPCAKKILSTLARRAYRRPVTEEDVQALLPFFKSGRSEGGFEGGIETALQRILVEPEFLYRIERDPADSVPDTAYPVTDVELASRLSFFLWSSIPDDELLDLAVRGRLKDPAILEQQVRRMLADGRSKALVENFAAQWLTTRALRDAAPNYDLFPEFDDNLREAFQRETELFVESQLREDHSVVDLLTANYTFANEKLARFYGIPNVYGSKFRRVTFTDNKRSGLFGHGSILLATSYPTRTSPVLRGRWVLDNILGTPPPPPPPNVPSLPENGNKVLSVRERLEQHRKSPLCSGCHAPMDPWGFALENFDAIGRWRANGEDGKPIDAASALPDGTNIRGMAGLQKALLDRREQFGETVGERLLVYSLGRPLESFDYPALRKIARVAAAKDYTWSSLILGVVNSVPFQMRRSQS